MYTQSSSVGESGNNNSYAVGQDPTRSKQAALPIDKGVVIGPWSTGSYNTLENGSFDIDRKTFTLSEDFALWHKPLKAGSTVVTRAIRNHEIRDGDVTIYEYTVIKDDQYARNEEQFVAVHRTMLDSEKEFLEAYNEDPNEFIVIDRGYGREVLRDELLERWGIVTGEVKKATRAEIADALALIMQQGKEVVPKSAHQALFSGLELLRDELPRKCGGPDYDFSTPESVLDMLDSHDPKTAARLKDVTCHECQGTEVGSRRFLTFTGWLLTDGRWFCRGCW